MPISGSVVETTNLPAIRALRPIWNKGRIVGQKQPEKNQNMSGQSEFYVRVLFSAWKIRIIAFLFRSSEKEWTLPGKAHGVIENTKQSSLRLVRREPFQNAHFPIRFWRWHSSLPTGRHA